MTTTIGSLDLNAFSDLYNDSNQYFWFESNSSATYGAGVHVTLVPDTTFISNPTSQNILMNTDGFSIRNGLLPMMTLGNDSLDFNLVDTTGGTYVNLATFGGSTRIGQEEVGYAKVLLSPSVFTFLSSESTSVFKTGVVSEETATSRIEISVDWDAPTTTGLQLGTYVLEPNSSTTVSGVFYSSVVASLDSGTRFGLDIGIYKNDLTYTYMIFNEGIWVAGEGFTTGEAKTITGSAPSQPNVSVYYDGVATFTISGTITNSNIVSWNFSRGKPVFTGQTEPIEAKIYNTFIGGNAFVNSSNGAVYIGLSQKSEARSSDYDLYNAITALGWQNDVMVNITLAEHTKTINTSGMLVDDTIAISTIVPLTATITITSSNTAVISGGSIVFSSEDDYYYIALDIVSTGTTTVTASMVVGDEIYSDSCNITVR